MEKVFLAKVKNDNGRDVVKYLDFAGFECDHYFGGLHIHGACFSGYEKELREIVENDFDNLETILTKEEFLKLFELNDRMEALGYGIEVGSDKYNKGIKIINEYKLTIENKILSEENEELFAKVVEEEKEYVMNEYNLSKEEVKAALKFNTIHNHEFIIESYGNLINTDALVAIPFSKYEVFMSYENKLCFKWKNKGGEQ